MKKLQPVVLAVVLIGTISTKAQDYLYTLTSMAGDSYYLPLSSSLMEDGSSTVVTYTLYNSPDSLGDIWVYNVTDPTLYTNIGDPSDVATLTSSLYYATQATPIDIQPGSEAIVAQFTYTAPNEPREVPPESPSDSGTASYLPPRIGLATSSAGISGTQIGVWDGDASQFENLTLTEVVGTAHIFLTGFQIQVTDVPSPPLLSAELSGTNLVIAWSSSVTNFQLQQSPTLLNSLWTATTNLVFLTNGEYQIIVPATNRQTFFRLRSQ